VGKWEGNAERKCATEYTKAVNEKKRHIYDSVYDEEEDKDFAEIYKRTVVDFSREKVLKSADGKVLRTREGQDFLDTEKIPDTVDPYLWRRTKLNQYCGIVELVKGRAYAAIGLLGSTSVFIRTDSGWAVIDTGSNVEGMDFVLDHLEAYLGESIRGKIKGVIYSHTHVDHYGGMAALLQDESFPIYAPDNWHESKIADHFGAGNAMLRRMEYQIGLTLPKDVDKSLAYGLDWDSIQGKASDIPPTVFIDRSQDVMIDGVTFYFYLTPDTETKAHVNVYVRDDRILYLADNSLDALHNVENIRGIPVRDAGKWGDFLNHLANAFGDEAEVLLGGHGYPHFNREGKEKNVKETLLTIAAAYKYINNQALHLENKGVTINELNQKFEVPDELKRRWYVRQHYGNWSFNARAVIQKFSGFFDGNPVHLNPLSPAETAEKWIAYVGSEEKVLEKAKEDYEKGEYQWVAEITNALVFRNPSNLEARYLNADALEQLGFQAETATWRNAYLTGAAELRDVNHEMAHAGKYLASSGFGISSVLGQLDIAQSIDHAGIALDGSRAGREDIPFLLTVKEENGEKETHLVHLYLGVLLHERLDSEEEIERQRALFQKNENYFEAETDRKGLLALDAGKWEEVDALFAVSGNAAAKEILRRLTGYIVDFSEYADFAIIEK
jgi:alkyl sulfatase BDS1-like metallo-beta-lactamase superfamily hydrolase